MICLALGFGILGFIAARAAHRRCHGGGWHYGHWGRHHGGWGDDDGNGGGLGGAPWSRGRHWKRAARKRWMIHAALSRIDATPAQERAIVGELRTLETKLEATKSGLRESRGDLAGAFRGSTLDDGALGAVLGKVDAATGEARAAIVDALRNIHTVLDDGQRAQIAELLETGMRGGWRGGGPYRM